MMMPRRLYIRVVPIAALVDDPTAHGVEVTQVDPDTGRILGPPVTLVALQRFDALGTRLGQVSSFTVSETGMASSARPRAIWTTPA